MSDFDYVMVMYDISSDKIRTRVAARCADYGLRRIQYSVFLGFLNASHRGVLEENLRDELGEEGGRIVVLGLPDRVMGDMTFMLNE